MKHVKINGKRCKEYAVIRYCPVCGYRYNINDMLVYTEEYIPTLEDITTAMMEGKAVNTFRPALHICKLCVYGDFEVPPSAEYWFGRYRGFDCISAFNWYDYHKDNDPLPDEDEQQYVRVNSYEMTLPDSISGYTGVV